MTLQTSAKYVGLALASSSILFIGFALSGWMVLRPYSKKFSNLSVTCCTLFSIIFGDDLYGTFSEFYSQTPAGIVLFLRVYETSFVALFSLVIFSIFIAIVHDAHHTIMQISQSKKSPPTSVLQRFLDDTKSEVTDESCLLSSDKAAQSKYHSIN